MLAAVLPLLTLFPAQDSAVVERQPAAAAPELTVAGGFRAERLLLAPRSLGSWVSLALHPDGSLWVSDQSRGLYRIVPGKLGEPASTTVVERADTELDTAIGGAQGLCFAFGSLYAVVNGERSGLYRLRDTDGNGRLDKVELLQALAGSGEHGPHAVLTAGDRLIVVAGNHTALPELAASDFGAPFAEDLLLPRLEDPIGHARGIRAPGGWICSADRDGKHWRLIAAGLRNAYDIALHPGGALFTYDADMEWDMGLPWYRPTRILHVVPGADFGWRTGSGKWPSDFPDTLPSVLDVGPGSPTGLTWGTGARFPRRYQEALYACDWTFGTVWAVHVEAAGASYRGNKEAFVHGAPLPVSDCVVGNDGALYFVTGGRGLQSRLYRVAHTGSTMERPRGVEPAALHTDVPLGVQDAIAALGGEDRFRAQAARAELERTPLDRWLTRALAIDPSTSAAAARQTVLACVALARSSAPDLGPRLTTQLARLELGALDHDTLLAALRAWQLVFCRYGAPAPDERAAAIARFDALLPHESPRANAELVALLAYLDAPSVIGKALELAEAERAGSRPDWAELIARNNEYGSPIRRMLADPPPVRAIELLYALRCVKSGWTREQRTRFFALLNRARAKPGGASYDGYLARIRNDAIETCTVAERRALEDVLRAWHDSAKIFEARPAKGPGREWTMREALPLLDSGLAKRDFAAGRNLFHAQMCAKCHRFDGEGGAVGPDLTTARHKFTPSELLETILEPSKVIADAYVATVVKVTDGSEVTGLVIDRSGGRRDGIIEVWPSDPDAEPHRIRRDSVASQSPSKDSPMPGGLANALAPTELLDLLAYVLSGGDPRGPMFRDRGPAGK